MKRRDPFYPRPRPLSANRRRIELLATGGLAAIAAALCLAPPGWAAPGSFQGSVATSVNANISTTATTTDINIYGSRAIIEWNPNDADTNATAPVDFQPAGTTATFSSSFLNDFTVLNVVNAPGSRVIGLNGAVKSQVSDGAGGLTTGGTVWFYSRNGFLVGSKASFDVGSLLLTANRPEGAYDPQSSDGYNHEFDNQVQTFSVEAGRSGTITISPGAQINASNYVALIAPHIVQGGAVRANGEIAYVGAESVDMSLPLNGGLFGISITSGTDGVGITHTGSTGGPASSASDQKRNIYMVTVPKNDAVTMLVSGSVGYDTAQSATTLADGTLLLAGGDTTIDSSGTYIPTSKADLPGTIKISDASFSNSVTAVASHLTIDAAQADLTFAGNATLRGVYDATMTVGAGRTATVGGNLTLQGWGLTDPDIGSQEGGIASLTIGAGATLALKGALTIDASGQGFSTLGQSVEQQNGSTGTGGTASLTLNDGTINGGTEGQAVLGAGQITVTADAFGGSGYAGGGDGKAGTASIVMNGGSILANAVLVSANGLGGGSESSSAASGAGTGGTAEIKLLAGTSTVPSLTARNDIAATATGTGGAGSCYYCYDGDVLYYAGGAIGGSGQGGTARITMAAGAISASRLLASASGQGGDGLIGAGPGQSQSGYANGGDGGTGTGGTALIDLSSGTATINSISVDAGAIGGQGGNAEIGEGGQSSDTGIGGNGGAAMGGHARIQVVGTSLLFSGEGGGSLAINTSAIGGDGGFSALEKSGDGGSAGHLANTVAQLQIGTGASLQAGQLAISAGATGGDGADYTNQAPTNKGGSAMGGAIEITQTGGSAGFSTTSLQATALRGIAGNRGDNFRGTAGTATGGSILAQTSGGTLSFGTLSLADVSGLGKKSEASTTLLEAGAGQGGTISFQTSGTGVLSASDASLSAGGHGGDGYIDANNGKAGQILIQAQDSSRINFTGAQIIADASATGGNNAHGVNAGGTATGGSVRIEAGDAAMIALPASTSLLVTASGGSNAAIGGQGTGGLAQIVASGGTVNGGTLTIRAAGTGGDAYASGSGGNIQLASSGTIQFTGGVDLDASGVGSTGLGYGGQIALTTTGGQGLSLADTTLSADGVSGTFASAGGITIQASASGITFASLDSHALGNNTISGNIAVSGLGAQVHSVGTAQFRTSGNVGLTASGAGGIVADGDLTVTAPGTVTLSHSQPLGQTLHSTNATFSVGDFTSGAGTVVGTTTALSINATGAITLEAATSGDVVDLTGIQGVQIGSVIGSGAAVLNASGMIDLGHARINIAAGDNTHAADIIINRQATAAGTVKLGATNDIIVAANATVRSSNLTQLVAGNDILVRVGASVTGAAAPLNANSGSLALTAGGGASPQPSVHSIIVDGALDGSAAPVTLTADAIQADGGTIRGGTLTATLVSVPFSGSPLDSDGGQLLGNCTGGSICLGGVTLTGALNIGQTGSTPANLVLTGNIETTALNLRSRDLMILGNAQAPITIHSSGQGSLTVNNGAISTTGSTTLTTAGDLLLSANVVQAPVLSAQAGGNLLLSVGHDVRLLDAIAAGQIASPDSSPSPISIAGAFTILGTLQAGAGPLDVTAAGIAVNRLRAASGVALRLASGSSADVAITDGSASALGSAASVSISGRAITIGQLASAGPVSLTGSGAVQVATDLAAAGSVSAQGASVSIKSLGALNFASLAGTDGGVTVNAAGALSLPSASATGALSLTSGGLLQVATNLAAGGPINLQGTGVALTLGNATSIASANATAGDLEIHDSGALTLTAGSATGRLDLTGSGITIGTVSAGGLFKAVATGSLGFTKISGGTVQLTAQGGAQGNAITGGTLSSTGAATLLANDAVTVSTDFAVGTGSRIDGSSVSLTSIGALAPAHIGATNGSITLRSGGDLTPTDATATGGIDIQSSNGLIDATGLAAGTTGVTARGTKVTLGATGALTVASATATAGDLTVTAGGDLAVTSGSATGAIRLISSGGALTFTTLTPGTDLLLHAHDNLSLVSLAAPGALDVASSAGAITATGPITAGGGITAQAATNFGFTSLSGSTLTLGATSGSLTGNRISASNDATLTAGGTLTVDTDIAVTGPLQATGSSIALTAAGALSLASATATGGGITLRSGGDLMLTQGIASGGIDIRSSNGIVNASGLITGSTGVTASGTNVTLAAPRALKIAVALASAGDLTITSAGDLVIAAAGATGALRATSLQGSLEGSVFAGGDLSLHSATSLTFGDLSGNGAIDLASSGGAISTGAVTAKGDVTVDAATDILFSSLSGRTLTLTAANGMLSGNSINATNGASLSAAGAVAISNDITVSGPFAVSGGSVALTATGPLSVTGAHASAGDLTIQAANGLTLGDGSGSGNVTLVSGAGGITIDTLTAGNGASLTAAGAIAVNQNAAVIGPFSATGLSVAIRAANGLTLTNATATGGDLTLTALNGNISATRLSATGATRLTATGTIQSADISGGGNVTAAGDSVTLTSAGVLTIDTLTAANGATLTAAGALSIIKDAAVTGAFAATGRSVAIQAANGLTLANATATGGDLTLAALNGSITGTHLSATGTAHLTATGAILSGDISAGGGVTAAGSSIALTAPGALTLTSATASAGDLIAQAAGDLTLVSGSATRSINLTSTGGAVIVHDASVAGVQTVRSLAAAATNSGDIAINAATNATLDGTIYTGGAIDVVAAGANVTGSVIGRTISFATRSMTIGSNARIGQAGTTTAVTFTNSGTQRSIIGGTNGDGYLLTSAGLGRVQADAIILNLPAAADGSATNPDVTINDLTLHGSTGTATGTLANLTSSGSFTINTPGRVRVSGKLLLTDLAPTNSASLIAGPEIDVVSPAGAIVMTNSSGAPTGSLTLAAQRIIVASQSALTDLASINGTDARSRRLATNDGLVTDQGYVAADHLIFRIASLLDVQNSGGSAPEARRGVTAGAGGLDIAVTAPGTPEIILNGRQATPAAFTSLIRVAAADGSFTPVLANGSTVNGCLVTTGCNTTPPTDTLLSLILPQQDVVGMVDGGSDSDDDKKQKNSSSNKPGSNDNRPLITIVKANPYGFGSIIDQPVTGTPNDDLWIDQPVIGVGNVAGEDPHH